LVVGKGRIAMFKSKKRIDPNSTDTLIGENSVFEGKIKSEASIRIEGQILGDVECFGDVIVGEQGLVKSNITARNAILAGTVNGNITVKDKLTVTSTGKLNGNIMARSFIIEEGGVFQGNSKMEKNNGNAELKDGELTGKTIELNANKA
jgi:cytoskeletal protein CcmA (bactofilin family)